MSILHEALLALIMTTAENSHLDRPAAALNHAETKSLGKGRYPDQ